MKKNELTFDINVASQQIGFNWWKHSPTYKALQLVRDFDKVLDVGCAGGYMIEALKERHCCTYGIEMDPVAVARASLFSNCIYQLDMNKVDPPALPFGPHSNFDAILCLDVLEHLVRPDLWLKVFHSYLKAETGFLIVSLPNVARIEHRLRLLWGDFPYSSTGALSKGHLRFFTRASGQALLESSGFQVKRVLYTGFASMLPLFPNLTSYQFLYVCSKKI